MKKKLSEIIFRLKIVVIKFETNLRPKIRKIFSVVVYIITQMSQKLGISSNRI